MIPQSDDGIWRLVSFTNTQQVKTNTGRVYLIYAVTTRWRRCHGIKTTPWRSDGRRQSRRVLWSRAI